MKILAKVFTLLLFVLTSYASEASHVVGGDIEYECIGPRIWKVRLTIYRDCAGAMLCGSMACSQSMVARPNTTLNPAGCTATPNSVPLVLYLIKVEDISKPVKDLCGNSAKNGCTNLGQVTAGPYSPSVEKYIFEGTLNLSTPTLDNSNCKYWDISWDLCCRNVGIWNLESSGSQSFGIGATINIFDKSTSLCKNSSPIFKNEPVIVVCANQEIVYNMGGADSDGDLLTYEIAPSSQLQGFPVVYTSTGGPAIPFPLNPNKPPHSNYPQPNGPFVIIDSTTGYISFNGVNNTSSFISGNMNVRVKQWTNDSVGMPVLVGITQRDVQMFLINCPPNVPPKLTVNNGSLNNNTAFKFEINAGQQLCFTVTAKDTDVYPAIPRFDTTYISWDSSLVRPGRLTFGPTYTVGSGQPRPREDQWQFCWQTDSTEGRDLPYTFTVTAIDKACPSVGKVTQVFNILVKSTPLFGSTQTALPCGKKVYNLFKNKHNTTINAATIQIANSPNDNNFLNGYRTITTINKNPNAAPGDSLNQPRLMLADTFTYLAPGKYYTRMYYTTANPYFTAPFVDSIEISNNQTVAFISANKPTGICEGDSIFLSTSYSQPHYKYQWFLNNNNYSTQSNLWVKAAGTYTLTVVDTILNCTNNSNPIIIQVNPKPLANFYSPSLCTKATRAQAFIDISTIQVGNTTRTWQFGGSIDAADTAVAINKSFAFVGPIEVKMVSISNFGCKDSVMRTYYVDPQVYFPSTSPNISCQKDTTTLAILVARPYYTSQWYKDNVAIPNATWGAYAATTSGRYTVLSTNTMNNCKDTAGIFNLIFYPKPTPIAKLSANNLCVSNRNLLYTDSSSIQSGNYTRLWRFGDGTTSTAASGNKLYNSIGSYIVKLILTSDKNCKDSAVSAVNVNNTPIANVTTNSGTNVCEGKLVQLNSTYYPNATYYWYKNNQLINNSDTNNLVVTSSGDYKLVIDNGGVCRDTSNNINIQVNPSPKAGFTINNNIQCLNGNSFWVTDTSFMSSGSYSRTWLWGNNTESLQSVNISFANAGTYPIKLKVAAANGCSDSVTKTVMVLAQPNIGNVTGPTTVLDTQLVYDYNVSQQSNHTYKWSVTNGTITTGQGTNAIKVQWLSNGTGIIKAIIVNNTGCTDSATLIVSVGANAPTITSFTPQTGTNGTQITINGSNLNGASAVLFGGVNAKNFNVVSPSVITALVDTGATGNVSVITTNGTALLSGFTYINNTGVAEYVTQSYSIFPNPVSSEIMIESDKTLNNSRFELMDLNGKVLINTTCNTSTNRLNIDVKTLSAAIYLLRITSQGQTNTVKIVKQ
jgi:hypothetical protein